MSSVKPKKTKIDKQKLKNVKPKNVSNEEGEEEKSIVLENEIDPCAPKEEVEKGPITIYNPGQDPRFQQQNQTLRCYVMYTDFYQCEHILGEGAEACTWFKEVFKRFCPRSWVERWDTYRSENRMPWFKRAKFPEAPYGRK